MEQTMADEVSGTLEKALAINLDPLKYGTIVEIGAGQEVARWFFQAGAAAGTVAKTMSAYDMKFSDEIYGESTDRRYVSRPRLERMLEREFDLLVSRVRDHRPRIRPSSPSPTPSRRRVSRNGTNATGGWASVSRSIPPCRPKTSSCM